MSKKKKTWKTWRFVIGGQSKGRDWRCDFEYVQGGLCGHAFDMLALGCIQSIFLLFKDEEDSAYFVIVLHGCQGSPCVDLPHKVAVHQ